jgi:hypothetical protein
VLAMPRSPARSFRAVVRRCLLEPGSRSDWPPVLARSDGQALTLQACRGDVGVRHTAPTTDPAAALAFRASVLAQFEGRTDAPVTLEQLAPDQGQARWSEGGVPRAVDFDTVTPDSAPALPRVPARLRRLRGALHEATTCPCGFAAGGVSSRSRGWCGATPAPSLATFEPEPWEWPLVLLACAWMERRKIADARSCHRRRRSRAGSDKRTATPRPWPGLASVVERQGDGAATRPHGGWPPWHGRPVAGNLLRQANSGTDYRPESGHLFVQGTGTGGIPTFYDR